MPHPEVRVQNDAIHAVVATAQQILVERVLSPSVMKGRLQAPYPSFKLPRRGHFFAAPSAKKRSTLALPERIKRGSLTSLCEKVVKIGANVIPHARYTMSQIAEVAVPRQIFQQILSLIARLRARRASMRGAGDGMGARTTGEVRLEEGKQRVPAPPDGKSSGSAAYDASCARISLRWKRKRQTMTHYPVYPGNVGLM
jgi:hypothetical protein